jgi:transglutaminase-like putative cysteine protease
LALLLVALAAHAPALAPASWAAFALALCSRLLPRRRWTPVLRLLFLAAVLAAAGAAFGWLDSRALRIALLLVLALKWAEARDAREFALFTGGALVAGAIGLLQWGEWAGFALIALLLLLALAVLETASAANLCGGQGGGGPFAARRTLWRALAPLRGGAGRIVLALPLAAMLFFLFPRIPGPLWDIGLTFGLPLSLGLEKSNQGLGVSTRLKPGQGQAQGGGGESAPVLVAEFENWVPPTSMLYWRGPVYYDFDGREWRLDPQYETGQGRVLMRQGWTKGSVFAATLAKKTQEIAYTIRLTPHERLWLYGLDLPAALAAESFVSADWQVLAHRPVEAETRYRLKSWLDWEAGGALGDDLRRRALALPAEGNPRLRALGAELAALPVEERVRDALAALAKGGYKVRDRFEFREAPDALDAFWFDSRTGNADLYAGAFVFLMRAAGVPARLVAGYRGGKLMALTDYVIVKKEHAHAWTEVWNGARGWQRIDPVNLIAPERFADPRPARGQDKAAPRQAPRPATAAQSPPQPRQPRPSVGREGARQAAPAPRAGLAPPAGGRLAAADDFFARWIFRLDGQAQQALLAGLGDRLGEKLGKTLGGRFAWVWLLFGAALGSAVVMAAMQALAWWRETRHLPPPQRDWNRLEQLLARRGFRRAAWECPSSFARRVGTARPAWGEALAALARAYTDWRYAAARADAPRRLRSAARKLHNLILADTGAPRQTPSPSPQ